MIVDMGALISAPRPLTICVILLSLSACSTVYRQFGFETEAIKPEAIEMVDAVLPGQPAPSTAVVAPTTEMTPNPPTKLPPRAVEIYKADAARDFERAKQLTDQGKESEALLSLTDFLRRYPEHNLADDAQYLIAEVWFRRRNFELSFNEFRKVATYTSGKGDRVADAGLRTGEALLNMGHSDRALIEWEAIIRRYPGSEAAKKAEIHIQGVK
jgi:TolA-binding protein